MAKAVDSRSPDSQKKKTTGNQGSPNSNFVEVKIEKYWDWKKRTAGDDRPSARHLARSTFGARFKILGNFAGCVHKNTGVGKSVLSLVF